MQFYIPHSFTVAFTLGIKHPSTELSNPEILRFTIITPVDDKAITLNA
jgi:hypothetical protein